MITADDVRAADGVESVVSGAFITGSYLVDRKAANDIDVVVGESAWCLYKATHQKDHLLLSGKIDVAGTIFERQENEDDDGGRYGDSENEMFELVEHWRGGGVNILVIRDIFIAAYKAASYSLEANPKKHTTREERVKTHQRMKGIIRNMLLEATE